MAQAEFDAIFVPLASSLFESFELGFSDFMNWKSFSSSWCSFCCWYIFINFSYNSLGMHVVPVYSVGKKNWFIIIRENGKYIEDCLFSTFIIKKVNDGTQKTMNVIFQWNWWPFWKTKWPLQVVFCSRV